MLANISLKLYERFKHAFFHYGDINRVNVANPNNKILMDLELDPRNKRLWTLTMKVSFVIF